MRVQAARIRQQPNFRVADSFRLQAEFRSSLTERRPVCADSQNGEKTRRVAPDFFDEKYSAFDEFFRCQFVGAGGRAFAKRRDAVAVLEQFVFFGRMQNSVGKSAEMQRLPKAIARFGEMKARRARPDSGIDAAEKNSQILVNQIFGRAASRLAQIFFRRFKFIHFFARPMMPKIGSPPPRG